MPMWMPRHKIGPPIELIDIDVSIIHLGKYIHNQTTPSDQWVIQHNLGTTDLIVQVYADDSQATTSITIVDENTVVVDLSVATTGKAIIL